MHYVVKQTLQHPKVAKQLKIKQGKNRQTDKESPRFIQENELFSEYLLVCRIFKKKIMCLSLMAAEKITFLIFHRQQNLLTNKMSERVYAILWNIYNKFLIFIFNSKLETIKSL